MLKKWLFKNTVSEDFSALSGNKKLSRKELLIEQCKKHDVSVYIDDASETSTSIFAELRGVASEAELENRLNSKRALSASNQANIIAAFALLISILAPVIQGM